MRPSRWKNGGDSEKLLISPETSYKWSSKARLFVALLFLGGCTTAARIEVSKGSVRNESLQVIALVFSAEASDVERQASDCIRTAIETAQLPLQIVSPDEFRKVAFPDLAPEAAIHRSEYLSVLLPDQRFRDRIAPLGIRYIVSISGVTEQNLKGSGHALGHDGRSGRIGGALFIWQRRTQLQASLLDLTRPSPKEDIFADASGTPWLLIIGGLPLYIPADTDSKACRDLGGSIVEFLKKAASEP